MWQNRWFSHDSLVTVSGEPLVVHHPGLYNHDSGPDFLQARISIGGVEWSGSVEIHLRSSDYHRHRHSEDPAYDPVILHVVWKQDREILHGDGTAIPALELSARVDPDLLKRYRVLAESALMLPCHRSLMQIDAQPREAMIRDALVRRLDAQALRVLALRQSCNGDWNETFYRLLARSFGLRVNAEAFFRLSELIPLRILLRNADRPQLLEALLFGASGFLSRLPDDNYQLTLQETWFRLREMYGLREMNTAEWKFMRMRPSGFPTLKIARFAAVVPGLNGILSELLRPDGPDRFRSMVLMTPSDYWASHTRFGRRSVRHGPGEQSADIMVINALVPFLAAWAKFTGDFYHLNVAIDLLESMSPEQNQTIGQWERAGLSPADAAGSQALNWQIHEMCRRRRCLECEVGRAVLGGAGQPVDLITAE